MTENEYTNEQMIDFMYDVMDWNDAEDEPIIYEIIEALKEIQQYRAIGTVKGYERAIEVSKENYNLYKEYKAKVQEFEAIGTIEEFKALKEKSVAKKPLLRLCGDCQRDCVDCDRYENRCPTCNGGLYVESGKPHEHCPHCGRKLDWSE